jgi:protein-arginine kinase activator protein McsA
MNHSGNEYYQCQKCGSYHKEISYEEAMNDISRLTKIYQKISEFEQEMYNIKFEDIPRIEDFYRCQHCYTQLTEMKKIRNITVKNPAPIVLLSSDLHQNLPILTQYDELDSKLNTNHSINS